LEVAPFKLHRHTLQVIGGSVFLQSAELPSLMGATSASATFATFDTSATDLDAAAAPANHDEMTVFGDLAGEPMLTEGALTPLDEHSDADVSSQVW
jgi:hypothetical protein